MGGKGYAWHESVFFTPNQGQWNEKIRFQLKMNPGHMYLENQGATYLFLEMDEHARHQPSNTEARAHCLRMNYVGANPDAAFLPGKQTPFYYNYFTGNDPARWKSGLHSSYELTRENIYPGIDLMYYGNENGNLKYDFLVSPGADASVIRWKYAGADKIKLQGKDLVIETSICTLTEKAPLVWQMIQGKKVMVECRYALAGDSISFVFPNGYDEHYPLVIDPILVFSSYSGSTADNFGFTATYDAVKNTFGAGIVYPNGQYPVTPGAFQTSFNGLVTSFTRDIGLSKFNVSGSTLIYSTYLGGTGTEAPHSIVCNSANELYIMGTTGSLDFPMAGAPFDNTFNGGTNAAPPSSGMSYNSGSDIFVARFNPTGTALLSSTYIGGTQNDGLNLSTSLAYNYGDPFRGEVIVDATGDIVVASVTSSADFPTSANAPEPVFGGGGYDGVVFRMNASLSVLNWSTYFGGAGADAAYGVQEDSNGDVYVAGGSESPDLLVSPGALQTTYSGAVDGFAVRYSPSGNSILACSYFGTSQYDQCYFVQIDLNNDVYVVGQTAGNYPITPAGVYNNGNSGQFIHKFNNSFTSTDFSTRVGRNAGVVDFSPSAFLVNKCGQIYLCGWGGFLAGIAPYHASSSSTTGLPVTIDGLQLSTDGNDFYLMILAPDATQLLYGTYLGAGSPSEEHVDGGTSRFDKDGVVYQAVCGGCGGQSNFPTTPGVWSNTNNSPNCNLVVFKIDLKDIVAQAQFSFTGDPCQLPVSVQLQNNSVGAIGYYWDFGDGDTSVAVNPNHTYSLPGTYEIMLVALDSNTCNGADTAYVEVFIPGPLSASVLPGDTICNGEQTTITASGGATYSWTPTLNVIGANTATPLVSPTVTTDYTVIVADTNGCLDTQQVHIEVLQYVQADMDVHFTPCVIPALVQFENNSSNGITYQWIFGNGQTSTDPDEQIFYTAFGYYDITLIATANNTCNISDTAYTQIYLPPPAHITAGGADTICSNQTAALFVSGADSYTWFPPFDIDDPNSAFPIVGPDFTTTYGVIGVDTNGCADTAFVTVNVFPPSYIDAGPDVILDIGDAPVLNPVIPGNGTFYWSPPYGLSCTDCAHPVATPEQNTWYYLTFEDDYGCVYVDSMEVILTPSVFIPNAFTPNADEHNNIFQPVVRNLATYEFWIFNRWGEVIFHSTNPNEGWNGTFKNVMCLNDVYVWKIEYSDYIEPDIYKVKMGHVTLVK